MSPETVNRKPETEFVALHPFTQNPTAMNS